MLLKKGSSGEDVKKLQQKLGLTADGKFGPGTEAVPCHGSHRSPNANPTAPTSLFCAFPSK